uniref:HTH cro/C1-type domain-containing protein n=1 Tax=Thermosporothrix sp. COM3 TaxID=2490863 RepID=A0A455SRG2_9CHLR|nr:hypothetical protein KTC_42030 [Thermosporothrix sp. COM3]
MTKRPIHPLRAMREHLNLTQKRLAEEAGVGAQTILRAEHNKPINAESRRLLCDYFGMTPEALGLVNNEQKAVDNRRPPDTPAIALQEIPTSPIAQAIAQGIVLASKQLESADMAHTRFHVLQRYGLAPHLTQPLPDAPPLWQRLTMALKKPTELDDMTLKHLEAITRDCWSVLSDMLGIFSQGMLNYVLQRLEVVTTFLESPLSAEARHRLARVAGELAQVVGEILFDLKEHEQAEYYYNVALEAARMIKDEIMQAVILGRKCFIPLYNRNAQQALTLLQEAHTLSPLYLPEVTRAWLWAIEAEAHALLRNEAACQKALDMSECFLERGQPGNLPYTRFNSTTLLNYKGTCRLRLHQTELAIQTLHQSLLRLDTTRTRQKAIVYIDLASAYCQANEMSEACLYAQEALYLIGQIKSARVFQRFLNMRRQLDSWQKLPSVKSIDEHIATLRPLINPFWNT